jgi:hypothetical protein
MYQWRIGEVEAHVHGAALLFTYILCPLVPNHTKLKITYSSHFAAFEFVLLLGMLSCVGWSLNDTQIHATTVRLRSLLLCITLAAVRW